MDAFNDLPPLARHPDPLSGAPADLLARAAPRGPSRTRFYSRFVTIMKFLLPTVALAMVALLFIWPQIHVDSNQFSLGFAHLKISSAEFPSMVNARFVGTDRRNQPFAVTADIAKSISIGASNVELEMPKADLTQHDGSWVVLTANTGDYDQKAKTLKLDGQVTLFHDAGYEFKTASADVDFNAGTAVGDKPIEGQGPWGTLQAQGFRITDDGKRLLFTGKAKLVVTPAEEAPQ
jgi:lipopolysaccharide export system protein LptC